MSSYRTILKTTGLVGGARVFTIAANLAKAKVIASLLGPTGIGIYGLYQSMAEMLIAVGDLGIAQSGVRQIALANANGDRGRVSVVYSTMSQTVLFSAGFLAATMCLFSRMLSQWLFGSEIYRWGICVLSVYVFCSVLSKTQLATLNGLRHIRDMTFSQIAGAVAGGVLACTMVFFWREQGIAFAFAGLGGGLLMSSWLFLRRLKIPLVKLDWGTRREEWKGLLGLGIGLLVALLTTHVTNYYSRLFIRKTLGLEAVGIYQSCWSVSNLYVGLVLAAMGVDFLPRLMKYVQDRCLLAKNLNEQMELGLVFGLPCVVGTFLFAPWILRVLYSPAFVSAAGIIRWQIVGVGLRLVAWPLGYLLIALGRMKLYVASHLVFHSFELLLLLLFVHFWQINGLGPQFLLAYCIYLGMLGCFAVALIGFKPSRLLLSVFSVFVLCLVASCGILVGISGMPRLQYVAGGILWLLVCAFCLYIAIRCFGFTPSRVLRRFRGGDAK